MITRGVKTISMQDYLTAEPPDGIDLDRGCRGWHHDDGADAQPSGGKRDALGVIAGGRTDDAPRSFFGTKCGDAIVRSPDFEGENALQVFAFEEHFDAETGRKLLHGIERCLDCDVIDRGSKDASDVILHFERHGGKEVRK